MLDQSINEDGRGKKLLKICLSLQETYFPLLKKTITTELEVFIQGYSKHPGVSFFIIAIRPRGLSEQRKTMLQILFLLPVIMYTENTFLAALGYF